MHLDADSHQLTLMDANYVMDETLGTASLDISKIQVGQSETKHFLIGKVSYASKSSTLIMIQVEVQIVHIYCR